MVSASLRTLAGRQVRQGFDVNKIGQSHLSSESGPE